MYENIEIIKKSNSITDASINVFGYSNGKSNDKIKEMMNNHDIPLDYFKRNRKNSKWKSIEKKCPICDKKFSTLKNHPKEKHTCSRKCSNIYFSNIKKHMFTEKKTINCYICGKEIQVDKRASKSRCGDCRLKYNSKKLPYKVPCKKCGKLVSSKNKTGMCKTCISKDEKYKEKLRKIQLELVKNGEHQGWKTRKGLEPSYPEKYFIDLLNNESISFEREEKAGKYFVDFFLSKNVVLEIDGKQHEYDDRKESDIKKDYFLRKNGYHVYRIKWKTPINEKNKKSLYSQIDNFITWYYEMFI